MDKEIRVHPEDKRLCGNCPYFAFEGGAFCDKYDLYLLKTDKKYEYLRVKKCLDADKEKQLKAIKDIMPGYLRELRKKQEGIKK